MAQGRQPGMEQSEGSSSVRKQTDFAIENPSSSSHLSPSSSIRHPLGLSLSAPHYDNLDGHTRRRRQTPQRVTDTNSQVYQNGKGKAKYDASKHSTLDKLENWLGISAVENSNRNVQYYSTSTSQPTSRQEQKPKNSRSTKLVVVHPVSSSDNLESIALRYKTDVRIIRRANGFWPGDSVTTRKELYIPIEEDSEFNQMAVLDAGESLGGKLFLLKTESDNRHVENEFYSQSKPLSSRSISSLSATSQSQSAQPPSTSQEVRRMPVESLSHFPPPGLTTPNKGRERDSEVGFAYAEALRPGRDIDHGESGVDDLLQLAEKARSRGATPSPEKPAARPLRSTRSSIDELESISPSSSFLNLDEPWKPNRWTFGPKNKPVRESLPSLQGDTRIEDTSNRVHTYSDLPAMMPSSSYKGWNDIPEPPLHQIAKGKVAHAYKEASKSKRYPRHGNVNFIYPSAAIFEDLAAGLPPNSGPAANWARPIADSVPIPDRSARTLRTSRSFTRPVNHQGWAQIFSDTVRGKIGLDEALERGLEDIRSLTISSTSPQQQQNRTNRSATAARRALVLQPDGSINSSNGKPSRPSAEVARATLSENQSVQSEVTISAGSNALDGRRTSERSIHELKELDSRIALQDTKASTWAPITNPSSDNLMTDEGRAKGRKNIRNVDWLN